MCEQIPVNAVYELSLERIIDASPESLYRAWTEPDLLKQWFCPKPWGVAHAELDVRAGGSNLVVMQSPDGELFPNRGVYLEVIPNQKIVFTDAYTSAWVPSAKPFMTGTITLTDLGNGQTRYDAVVAHWNESDKAEHEAMGFYEGWGTATDQLVALVQKIDINQ
jgi:uncharacterized protein YndB with AHSA1/START domain